MLVASVTVRAHHNMMRALRHGRTVVLLWSSYLHTGRSLLGPASTLVTVRHSSIKPSSSSAPPLIAAQCNVRRRRRSTTNQRGVGAAGPALSSGTKARHHPARRPASRKTRMNSAARSQSRNVARSRRSKRRSRSRAASAPAAARFQFEDGGALGFVPEAAYEKQLAAASDKTSLTRGSPLCQRCHGLRFQNKLPAEALRVGGEATHAELQPDYFVRLLRDISRRRCVVIAIVDLFDFHGSLVPDLPNVVGDDNTLILVGNKLDLLPEGIMHKRIESWVRKESRKARLPPLSSVHLVSCKTGAGMPKLLDEMKELMSRKRLDAYVGAANAGKSSFINHILRSVQPGRSLTTSALPGTTRLCARVGDGWPVLSSTRRASSCQTS